MHVDKQCKGTKMTSANNTYIYIMYSFLTCQVLTFMCFIFLRSQVIVFLDRLHGDPIGFSVLGIFVIEKNTILMVMIMAIL